MQEAARLLAETNRSVADIALSVGYESQSKFGNVFKRKYGHTPLEYRRLNLSKKRSNQEDHLLIENF